MTYKGTTYEIAAGGTDKKYIYWDPNYTTLFRSSDDIQDVFDCDGWVMCINDEGTVHPAYGLPIIHARLIQAATITADKYKELRNTYVYNGDDSLDASYPFEVPFKIVSEMTSIMSVKLSFRIMPYRAYSTAAASGGGSTSGAGGEETTSGGGSEWWENTASSKADILSSQDVESGKANIGYGKDTESEDCEGGVHAHGLDPGTDYFDGHQHGIPSGTTIFEGHVHNLNLDDHTHTAPSHTHSTPDHVHDVSYGIHEESNSPTVHFHIDNGGGFGGASDNYNSDQLDIDITEDITGSGWKGIRFDTNVRCRIAAIIECKLDITA